MATTAPALASDSLTILLSARAEATKRKGGNSGKERREELGCM